MLSLSQARRAIALVTVFLSSLGPKPLEGDAPCPLSPDRGGSRVRVDGLIRNAGHDLILYPDGCEERVVLAMAGDAGTDTEAADRREDEAFSRLKRYLAKRMKGNTQNPCKECSLYEVEATVIGRLDVAGAGDSPGSRTEGRSANGFGHPMPFTRYRIVIFAVENVTPRRLPRSY